MSLRAGPFPRRSTTSTHYLGLLLFQAPETVAEGWCFSSSRSATFTLDAGLVSSQVLAKNSMIICQSLCGAGAFPSLIQRSVLSSLQLVGASPSHLLTFAIGWWWVAFSHSSTVGALDTHVHSQTFET